MFCVRHIFVATVLLLAAHPALGQTIPLQNLDEAEFKKVVGDFSTNFLHTSVSGASTLGHIFGFEIGVVGGQTKTPHIETLAHEVDPGAKADKIPQAALLGVLSVPLGFTVEANL